MSQTVCVTGASGYVASHCVEQLLALGHAVRGTVRDVSREDKTAHLMALPGADQHLKLFACDLLKPGSFAEAFAGCDAVFHVASPFFNKGFGDAEVQTAVDGTKEVLAACKKAGVKKVVVTSSMAAVMGKPEAQDHVWTEEDFSDVAFLTEKKLYYPLSKILAEQAAWDYVKAEGDPFKLIMINPTLVNGPMLQPTLNTSSEALLAFFTGGHKAVPVGVMSWVDVRDVAKAHVLALASESASGRYNVVAGTLKWTDCLEHMKEAVSPEQAALLPTEVATEKNPANRYDQPFAKTYDSSRLESLGMKCRPLKDSIVEHVKCPMFQALIPKSA